jgi:hypothetical protein
MMILEPQMPVEREMRDKWGRNGEGWIKERQEQSHEWHYIHYIVSRQRQTKVYTRTHTPHFTPHTPKFTGVCTPTTALGIFLTLTKKQWLRSTVCLKQSQSLPENKERERETETSMPKFQKKKNKQIKSPQIQRKRNCSNKQIKKHKRFSRNLVSFHTHQDALEWTINHM